MQFKTGPTKAERRGNMTTVGSQYRGTQEFLRVYRQLITAAEYRGLVTYTQVAHILGIHSLGHHMARQVGQILGEISEDEHRANRPMLSVVAVGSGGMPGEGFFGLARRLKKFSGSDPSSKRRFWATEQERVYKVWQPE
ncbi:MAG: hypothetical protein A3C53_03335 [Omnitrophica WOR_2 bacterium RIFCSPHIGHO2_02_FULL_68_15]|nr:MAG: hypothetical protein A3C53_03335 [Omnitrophica WOR_2 bacterium RIFCSPHIGHO2_02_FULL_68_15]